MLKQEWKIKDNLKCSTGHMTTINLRHPQAFNSEVFICIAPFHNKSNLYDTVQDEPV